MHDITSQQINDGWGYAWDCLVEACHDNDDLDELLTRYEELPDVNHINVVTALINHFFEKDTIRLISTWGFADTPVKDNMCLNIEDKVHLVKPYLEKYL